MKSIILSLLLIPGFCFISNKATCQLYVGGRNINDSTHIKVIEISAIDNSVYGGAHRFRWYSIEWGQAEDADKKLLTNAEGKRLPMHYPLSVANHVAQQGWKLFQVLYYIHGGAPYYKYTFTRMEN